MKEEKFIDGIWASIQILVYIYDEPTLAVNILKELGYDNKGICLSAQARSGSFEEEMKEFINNEIKS